MEDTSNNPYATPASEIVASTDSIAKALEGLQYPLKLSFKILALASQATLTDASGRTILYTRQKILKFKEHVEIFTDKSKTTRLADIRTNKILDWSARYFFTDAAGGKIGSVGRKGWRSIWRAHYNAFNPGDTEPDFTIREENAGAKIMDSILGEIPILGTLTGYLFHPRYLCTRTSGDEMMRMEKKPAFFEGKFELHKLGQLTPREEMTLLLSYLMMVLLERKRG
jgi:hypothetical protein